MDSIILNPMALWAKHMPREEMAALISEAPHLLSALEDVTAELSQLHSHHHPACEGGCPTVEYIMNARKVIAKAKGA